MARRTDYVLREPNWKRLHDGPMPVRTHTGAGDMIVQAGLMVELSKRYGKIAVPCYEKYKSLGMSLYNGFNDISIYLIPNIHPGHLCSPPDSTFDEACLHKFLDKDQGIGIGDYAGDGIWEDFAKGFYLQSGVEYRYRWDSFPDVSIPSWEQVPWPDSRRIFVHDDPSRGHIITRAKGVRPIQVHNILQYCQMLCTAEEIHVIDSAFFCLANHLLVKGKLFYHHYARPDRPADFRYDLRHEWNYVI
jgi:hypothetical protein